MECSLPCCRDPALRCVGSNPTQRAQSKKIQAKNLVEVTAPNHSEIASLEIAATPEGQKVCPTIAATEAKDVGEKFDADEETH